MDACAASIALGGKKQSALRLLLAACAFGFFQALMPALGYLIGLPFEKWITLVDHWIAFFILGGLGLNMMLDKEENPTEDKKSGPLGLRTIFLLAVATSIDAFVVGVGFHALGWELLSSITTIGLVTLTMSVLGIIAGQFFKKNLSAYAEKMGGLILILLGIKILLTHLLDL